MSAQPPEFREQDPGRGPHRLEYAGPNAPKPRGDVVGRMSLGCVCAVVAMLMSFAFITSDHWNSVMLFLVPALLLGGPFVFSLRVKGWRAFALGIGITVGLVVLLVGTCGVLLSH